MNKADQAARPNPEEPPDAPADLAPRALPKSLLHALAIGETLDYVVAGLPFIPAVLRRASFWMTAALVGNGLVWLLIWAHIGSLSPSAPQSLFGIGITYQLSMGLVFVGLAGVPCFALVFAWASARACGARRRRRAAEKRSQILCKKCGYDVRATPVRCPECGR